MFKGLYLHIPHCLQICTYCDFVKFELHRGVETSTYVDALIEEIQTRLTPENARTIESVYFGGGTPSLLSLAQLERILNEIFAAGADREKVREIALEINPGTLKRPDIAALRGLGFTRFSVGAQTFSRRLLATTGRKHSVQDTEDLLSWLSEDGVNFTLDLLFGLPAQTIGELELDVARAIHFQPPHVSAYALTVAKTHPLHRQRPSEDIEVRMYELLTERLCERGLARYELSNYAQPGKESVHNLVYWRDQSYLGLGVGAHSYVTRRDLSARSELSVMPSWGVRFWNPAGVTAWRTLVRADATPWEENSTFPSENREWLKRSEYLTDFFHTSLRTSAGLDASLLMRRLDAEGVSVEDLEKVSTQMESASRDLVARGLLLHEGSVLRATVAGWTLADEIFRAFTFPQY